MASSTAIRIQYLDHLGGAAEWHIQPFGMWFGERDEYPGVKQWYVRAMEVGDRDSTYDFALGRLVVVPMQPALGFEIGKEFARD